MSTYTTYVQNSVCKHHTLKTFRNNTIKNIWTPSALDWIGSGNIAISGNLCNLELLNRLLDEKFIDFNEERKNSYEKCVVKKNERTKFDFQCLRNREDLEPHKSSTSKGQQLIREIRSEIM